MSLFVITYFVRLAASKQSSALFGICASKLTSSGGWASSDEGGASSMGSLMVGVITILFRCTLIVAAEDVLVSPGCPARSESLK